MVKRQMYKLPLTTYAKQPDLLTVQYTVWQNPLLISQPRAHLIRCFFF